MSLKIKSVLLISAFIITTIIIYAICVAKVFIDQAFHIYPESHILTNNVPTRNIYFEEIVSPEEIFAFYSSPNGTDGAELQLYGHISNTGILEKNVVIKSEDGKSYSDDMRMYDNLDQDKKPMADGECITLSTGSYFSLILKPSAGNSTFAYNITVDGNIITLSGLSENVRILLSSEADIFEFPASELGPLSDVSYEIVNCPKISFKMNRNALNDSEGAELIKINKFASFEMEALETSIYFENKIYPEIAGTCVVDKDSSATVYLNPLTVDINADLKSATSGNQDLMPTIWTKALTVFSENIIGALIGLYIVFVPAIMAILGKIFK